MRAAAAIRSRQSFKQEGSGSDQTALPAELLAAVPEGYEAEQFKTLDAKIGTVEVRARSRETPELSADLETYAEAKAELESSFDPGAWQLLSLRGARLVQSRSARSASRHPGWPSARC